MESSLVAFVQSIWWFLQHFNSRSIPIMLSRLLSSSSSINRGSQCLQLGLNHPQYHLQINTKKFGPTMTLKKGLQSKVSESRTSVLRPVSVYSCKMLSQNKDLNNRQAVSTSFWLNVLPAPWLPKHPTIRMNHKEYHSEYQAVMAMHSHITE